MGKHSPYIVKFFFRKLSLGAIYFALLTAGAIAASGIGKKELLAALSAGETDLTDSIIAALLADSSLQALVLVTLTLTLVGTTFALFPGTRIQRQVRINFKARRNYPDATMQDLAAALSDKKRERPAPDAPDVEFKYSYAALFRRRALGPLMIMVTLFVLSVAAIALLGYTDINLQTEYIAVTALLLVIVGAIHMRRITSWIDFLKDEPGVVVSRNGVGRFNEASLCMDMWRWDNVAYVKCLVKGNRHILRVGTRWVPPEEGNPEKLSEAKAKGTSIPIDLSLLKARPAEVFAAVRRVLPEHTPIYFSGRRAKKAFQSASFENRTSALRHAGSS